MGIDATLLPRDTVRLAILDAAVPVSEIDLLPPCVFFIFTLPPEISLANDLIKKYCDSKENLFYISTRDFFITKNGLPSEEFFIKDKLHLNKKGYKLWAEIIKNSLKPIVSHN